MNAFKQQISGHRTDNGRAKASNSSASAFAQNQQQAGSSLQRFGSTTARASSLPPSSDSQIEDSLRDGTQGTIIQETHVEASMPQLQHNLSFQQPAS